MNLFWFFLYNILFYPLVFCVYLILAIVNSKVRSGFTARFRSISILKNHFSVSDNTSDVYWFHVASLGEFMQLLPVLAKLKVKHPKSTSLVSFFSPSGFNHCDSDLVDLKIYLPFDFLWTVNQAIDIVKPKKIIFVSYDVWPNLLWSAKRKGTQTNIFATIFEDDSNKLLQPISSFYFSLFSSFDAIYTIAESDKLNLKKILGDNHSLVIKALGNPRYDNVYSGGKKISSKVINKSNIKKIILGSTHNEDVRNILNCVIEMLNNDPDLKLICVPHETTQQAIAKYQNIFLKTNIKTTIFEGDSISEIPEDRVVIIGVVGLLSRLYNKSSVAYIGGGFSSGIHNVMEPAAKALPVIFGPNYKKFNEAEQLIEMGGGFSISSGSDFKNICTDLLSNSEKYSKASEAALCVIEKNIGASEKIFDALFKEK